jgi:hypothetical protein
LLGWTPAYRSYRDGIEDLIDSRAMPETSDLGMLRGDDRAGVDVVVKITLGLNSATMPFFGFWSLALPGGGTGHEPSTGWCHGQWADLASDDVAAVADAVERSDGTISAPRSVLEIRHCSRERYCPVCG